MRRRTVQADEFGFGRRWEYLPPSPSHNSNHPQEPGVDVVTGQIRGKTVSNPEHSLERGEA